MFVGREKELMLLKSKIATSKFEFGLIYGRRRIGKTYLLQEIVKEYKALYFSATEMGLDYNLESLSKIIADYFEEPVNFMNFEDIFIYLKKRSTTQRIVFIIDEFTYLMSSEKAILSVLQNIIDRYLLDSNIKLILSGSQVGMVEDAISYKKPLYGRSTFKIKLEPFSYYESAEFYTNASDEDKVRFYSVFGGVPFYTSKIDDNKSVRDNILDLIIREGSVFGDEVQFFLSQEVRSVSTYARILNALASGATRLTDIVSKSGSNNTGNISTQVETLMMLGIVEKEICFGENENSRKTIYHIKDQLFNFYYTFIEKNKTRKAIMEPDVFYDTLIEPHFDEFVSFEFETICKEFLIRDYRNSIQEIGRYWYNDAKLRKDVEIDIVMKESQQITVFECKWTNSLIDKQIMVTLKKRAEHLNAQKLGFFSKKGYTLEVKAEDYELYSVSDLYK